MAAYLDDEEYFDQDLLVALANSLGSTVVTPDGKKAYKKAADCLETLKDLQRFLRRDDPNDFPAFRLLGKFNVAKRDLIPIIKFNQEDTELVYQAVKVATLMTMPMDPMDTSDPAGLNALQRDVRSAFLDEDALALVMSLAVGPLSRFPKMNDRDAMMVQLVVSFVRNLLIIPNAKTFAGGQLGAATAVSAGHTSLSAEDQDLLARDARSVIINRLVDTGSLDLIMTCAQHCERNPFKQDVLVMLELFDAVFTSFRPVDLMEAHSEMQRKGLNMASKAAREKTTAALMLSQALTAEAGSSTGPGPVRHARFKGYITKGGVNVTTNRPDALTGSTLKPLAPVVAGKGGTKKLTIGMSDGAAGGDAMSGARLDVLLRVKKAADKFLDDGSFDILMSELKRDFARGYGMGRMERVDVARFLRLCAFFVEYARRRIESDRAQRQKDPKAAVEAPTTSPFGQVSVVLAYDMFKEVYELWSNEADKPVSVEDKDWELMHGACSLFKEMLFALDAAIKHGTPNDLRAADRLQRKLLHDNLKDSGLVPLLARAVKAYDWKREGFQPAYNLVESIHVVLKTLDRLSQAGALIRVKARHGGGGKKKQAPAAAEEPQGEAGKEGEPAPANPEQVDKENGEVAAAAPLLSPSPDQAKQPRRIVNVGSLEDEEEGTGQAPGQTQTKLTDVAAAQKRKEEEKQKDAAFFVEDAEDEEEDIDGGLVGGGMAFAAGGKKDPRAALDDYDEEDDEDTREVALDLKKMARTNFAHADILAFYCQVLKRYKSNPRHVNHYLVTFFKRVSGTGPHDLNLMPMLWQLSVLRVFHAILDDKTIYGDHRYQDLLKFTQTVTESLFTVLVPPKPTVEEAEVEVQAGEGEGTSGVKKNSAFEKGIKAYQSRITEVCGRTAFVELLFWHTPKCAEEMQDQYGYKERLQRELEAGPRGPSGRGRRDRSPGGGGDKSESDGEVDVDEILRGVRDKRRDTRGEPIKQLTDADLETLKEVYARLKHDRDPALSVCADPAIAPLNLSKDQVMRQLKKLGVWEGRQTNAAQNKRMRAAKSCATLLRTRGIDGESAVQWLWSRLSECAEFWEDSPRIDEDFWLIPIDAEEIAYLGNRSFRPLALAVGLREPEERLGMSYWAVARDRGAAGARSMVNELEEIRKLAYEEIRMQREEEKEGRRRKKRRGSADGDDEEVEYESGASEEEGDEAREERRRRKKEKKALKKAKKEEKRRLKREKKRLRLERDRAMRAEAGEAAGEAAATQEDADAPEPRRVEEEGVPLTQRDVDDESASGSSSSESESDGEGDDLRPFDDDDFAMDLATQEPLLTSGLKRKRGGQGKASHEATLAAVPASQIDDPVTGQLVDRKRKRVVDLNDDEDADFHMEDEEEEGQEEPPASDDEDHDAKAARRAAKRQKKEEERKQKREKRREKEMRRLELGEAGTQEEVSEEERRAREEREKARSAALQALLQKQKRANASAAAPPVPAFAAASQDPLLMSRSQAAAAAPVPAALLEDEDVDLDFDMEDDEQENMAPASAQDVPASQHFLLKRKGDDRPREQAAGAAGGLFDDDEKEGGMGALGGTQQLRAGGRFVLEDDD